MAQVNADKRGYLLFVIPAKAGIHTQYAARCTQNHFSPEVKSSASIIGPICAFDTKKHKNVDTVFAVSACGEKNKKIFKISCFCSALSSLLVEMQPNSKLKTLKFRINCKKVGGLIRNKPHNSFGFNALRQQHEWV